jgi:hypothetical protein
MEGIWDDRERGIAQVSGVLRRGSQEGGTRWLVRFLRSYVRRLPCLLPLLDVLVLRHTKNLLAAILKQRGCYIMTEIIDAAPGAKSMLSIQGPENDLKSQSSHRANGITPIRLDDFC